MFFENVLSNELIREYFKEIKHFMYEKKEIWGASNFKWADELRGHVPGSCLFTSVSKELKGKILDEIKHKLPPCPMENIGLQHYVWMKNSGINWHNDGGHIFGATIYMNKDWNANYGGVFVWNEKSIPRTEKGLQTALQGHLRAYCPVFNTMAINEHQQHHLVTTIEPSAPENRFTIQIWGLKNRINDAS